VVSSVVNARSAPRESGVTQIRVVGIGGAGNNAINRMVDAGCAPKPGHRKIHLQIFGPKTELGGSLDFNTKRMRILVDRGYHRALAWLRDEAIEP